MLVVEIVVAAVVVFGVAAVAMGYGGSITNFAPDWPGRPLPEGRTVRPDDITNARFSLSLRGYRMSEVDEALDRLSFEIAQRDARIEQLTGRPFDHSGEALAWQEEKLEQPENPVEEHGEPDAETPASAAGYQPVRFDDTQIQPGIVPVAPDAPRMPELPQPPAVDPLASPADHQAVSEEPIYEQTFHEHDAETLADNPFAPPRPPADPGSADPRSGQ